MSNTIVKPGLYAHFKGAQAGKLGKVVVFSVSTNTEAHHVRYVNYREFRTDGTLDPENWSRPFEMFTQRIVRDLAAPGQAARLYDGPRFQRVGTWGDALAAIDNGGEVPEPVPEPAPAPAPALAPDPTPTKPDAAPEPPIAAASFSALVSADANDTVESKPASPK